MLKVRTTLTVDTRNSLINCGLLAQMSNELNKNLTLLGLAKN